MKLNKGVELVVVILFLFLTLRGALAEKVNLEDDCHINNGSYYNYTEVCISDIKCYYNSQPFLKTKIPFTRRDYIDFYCSVNLTSYYSCISEVYKEGNLLQTNPDVEVVNMYGMVNSFDGDTPIIRGWYRKGTLLPDTSFNVNMRCSDGNNIVSYNFNIEPKYKELAFGVDKAIWLKRNWAYVFALVFLIMFGLIILYAIRG